MKKPGGRKKRFPEEHTLAETPSGPSGTVVVDASAVLALLYREPGEEEIRKRLRGAEAIINAVNFSEVAAKLSEGRLAEGAHNGSSEGGFDAQEIREAIGALALEVRPFDDDTALAAGLLRVATKDRGLSLGDRACVAHARQIGGVALTVDRAWKGLDGVEVISR